MSYTKEACLYSKPLAPNLWARSRRQVVGIISVQEAAKLIDFILKPHMDAVSWWPDVVPLTSTETHQVVLYQVESLETQSGYKELGKKLHSFIITGFLHWQKRGEKVLPLEWSFFLREAQLVSRIVNTTRSCYWRRSLWKVSSRCYKV